jgi:hypothetical protein
VFVGMLAASTVGVLLTPMLFDVFRWMREKVGRKPAPKAAAAAAPPPLPGGQGAAAAGSA